MKYRGNRFDWDEQMKIVRMSEKKIGKKRKELNKRAQKQLNKVLRELKKFLKLEHFYKKLTFCTKCKRLSHARRDDGSFSSEAHKEISNCSYNVTLGCALRTLLDYFIPENEKNSGIHSSLIEICKEANFDLSQFIDDLIDCN